MRLHELSDWAVKCRESAMRFEGFHTIEAVRSLHWPADVVGQFLYDHADNESFLNDYGLVDLSHVSWDVEVVPTLDLCHMPTGASDGDCIGEYAEDPDHWIRVRSDGIHKGVSQMWEEHGTWKRWPILIDRTLLDPSQSGLQVVEGRTRVGILRGRHRNGAFVAERHLAWVGRLSG